MKRSAGFTLLEVLIAVALLGAALTMVVVAQSTNAAKTAAARDLTVATMLARLKLGEVEIEIRKEQTFDDLGEDCGSGDFSSEGYDRFHWECKNEPLELNVDPEALLSSFEAIANGEQDGGILSLAADFGGFDLAGLSDSPQGQMVMQAFPLFTETLASAIRRITLTLWWTSGNERLEFKVVMFLTDPARVSNPLGGGAGGGLGGGTPGGTPGQNPGQNPGGQPTNPGGGR
jgi:general secretion pathway protein I